MSTKKGGNATSEELILLLAVRYVSRLSLERFIKSKLQSLSFLFVERKGADVPGSLYIL